MTHSILGFLTPFTIYACITLLHLFLPAKWIEGYVRHSKTGERLKYRINGRLVLIVSILSWAVLGAFKIVPWEWLYSVRFPSTAGAMVIGVLFSLLMVLPYPSGGKALPLELFFGRLENPQFQDGRIDAKMWLYLIGAVMLELNVLSFTAFHFLTYGAESSAGIFMAAAMISFFVFDYLSFEKVHLYTYDFFAEKVGLKLGWGCLSFYPYFYSIALYSTVHLPDSGRSPILLILYIILFLGGWALARGANMQKFYFKTRPEKPFMGIQPETITDGEKVLLVNGFWGKSRHINYLGEILMASGIALSVGQHHIILPFLYPLYYIALLFPRQYADDKRCAEKYENLWDEYVSRVKYRIIPFIY